MAADLTIVTFKWHPGDIGFTPLRVPFTAQHVNTLMGPGGMIERNFPVPHRRVCVTDDPTGVRCETYPLWADHAGIQNICGDRLPSCYRRMKILAESTTDAMGIERDAPVVWIDLDAVPVRDLRPLWERDDDYLGWRRPGSYRRMVYNGSMFMFRAGQLGWLWDEFDPRLSPHQARKAGYLGSDQAWLSYRLGDGPGWTKRDGVYSYWREVKGQLPPDARIVFFPGKRKPWHNDIQAISPWITNHWRTTSDDDGAVPRQDRSRRDEDDGRRVPSSRRAVRASRRSGV